MKSLALASLFVITTVCLAGCKDDSGSSYVKPNPSQANRYKQPGAAPGGTGMQAGGSNNAPQ
ncbi:MAG: hypothetical protein JST51_07195 [Armatimonadetes bacterium]|nr:hypothetical protein [Armatimonadota bacterium]